MKTKTNCKCILYEYVKNALKYNINETNEKLYDYTHEYNIYI